MSERVAAAATACWNCRQPLTAGTARCIWCGVTVGADAAPLVVAPAAAAPAVAIPPGLAAPVASAAARPAARSAAEQASPGAEPAPRATAAPRLVAVTTDLVLVAVVAVALVLLVGSLLLAAAVLAELLLLLWILDARTGATPGKALVRLRTARSGGAMSPGAGRSFGRGALTALGLLLGGVGAWVLAASAGFDPWRRSWADRATGTVTLVVPPRAPLPAAAATTGVTAPVAGPPDARPAPAAAPTGVLPPLPAIAEPRVVSMTPMRPTIDESSASEVPAALSPAAVAPVLPAPAATGAASLLLVFDTGQRVSLAAPVAVNLGRNPAATVAGDQLVAIDDPESTVSKTHARLEHVDGSTWVTDGGSTNGTELLTDAGPVPLVAGVRTLLGEGDRVRVGNRVFTVSVVVGGVR
jgi:hypothetical protein